MPRPNHRPASPNQKLTTATSLIGRKGSGKSFVAERFADTLGYPVDTFRSLTVAPSLACPLLLTLAPPACTRT